MLSPFIDSFVDDNTSKFGNIFPGKNQSFSPKNIVSIFFNELK